MILRFMNRPAVCQTPRNKFLFKFDYLLEFEIEFEKTSVYDSGVYIGFIPEKISEAEISCYHPFMIKMQTFWLSYLVTKRRKYRK
jgi:hypothetical protein